MQTDDGVVFFRGYHARIGDDSLVAEHFEDAQPQSTQSDHNSATFSQDSQWTERRYVDQSDVAPGQPNPEVPSQPNDFDAYGPIFENMKLLEAYLTTAASWLELVGVANLGADRGVGCANPVCDQQVPRE